MIGSKAIIVAARRTPIGKIGGVLRNLPVDAIAAPVLQALVEDIGIQASDIYDVILGNAAGGGGNPARLAALTAGFPVTVPGMTIDRQCGSGLEAINTAARMIEAGAGDIILAGGAESVSTAPWRVEKPKTLYQTPTFINRARFSPDSIGDPDMGIAAENVAKAFKVTRERQDLYALKSHQKAVKSIHQGRFHREIVPLPLSSSTSVSVDECPRAGLKLKTLARFPTVFLKDGTVTAGNACPVNDGAAAVLMVSEKMFRQLGLTQGLEIVDSVAIGVDPNLLGIGPVAAIKTLLSRNPTVLLEHIKLIEFNEAFAAQVLASLDALNIPEENVNIGGGALALGHPYGASGAVLVTRLFTEMVRSEDSNLHSPGFGLATLGIGGGIGIATLFRRV